MIRIQAIVLILIIFPVSCSCAGKPMYKSFTEISPGDSKEAVIGYWGTPHRTRKIEGTRATRELWIYECLVDVDCVESNCYFNAPCYILLFENDRLVHIHNAN